MKRAHECQYDDTSKKSRTQILREKVIVLEAKLRDLENEPSLSNYLTDASSHSTPAVDISLAYNAQQGTSPLSLSDSSGGDSSSDHMSEPIISLSSEMHNTLYVILKYLVYTL